MLCKILSAFSLLLQVVLTISDIHKCSPTNITVTFDKNFTQDLWVLKNMLLMTLVVRHFNSGFARNVDCEIVTLVIGRKHVFLPREFCL